MYISEVQTALSMYAASQMPRLAESFQENQQTDTQIRDTLIGYHEIDIIV